MQAASIVVCAKTPAVTHTSRGRVEAPIYARDMLKRPPGRLALLT